MRLVWKLCRKSLKHDCEIVNSHLLNLFKCCSGRIFTEHWRIFVFIAHLSLGYKFPPGFVSLICISGSKRELVKVKEGILLFFQTPFCFWLCLVRFVEEFLYCQVCCFCRVFWIICLLIRISVGWKRILKNPALPIGSGYME